VIVLYLPVWVSALRRRRCADVGYAGIFSSYSRTFSAPAKFARATVFGADRDLGAQSLLIHLGDEITSIFFPLCCGRSSATASASTQPLMSATVVALMDLPGVVLTTPFWKEHVALSVGSG